MSLTFLIIPTLIYIVYSYIRLNFFNIKSFLTKKDFYRNSLTSTTEGNYKAVYSVYTVVWVGVFASLYSFILPEFTELQPQYVFSFILLTAFAVYGAMSFIPLHGRTSNFEPVSLLLFYTSLLLFTSSNLYQIYILIEILAYINLLFLALNFSTTQHTGKFSQTIVALIISFIVNFISSIVFFALLIVSTWYAEYPTWLVLNNFTWHPVFSFLTTMVVLIKFGVGPWLIGSIHSYTGYSLQYLLTYTVVMVLVVAPVLLNSVLYINCTPLTISAVIFFLIFLLNMSSSLNSLKQLFAISTSIIYAYLLLIIVV